MTPPRTHIADGDLPLCRQKRGVYAAPMLTSDAAQVTCKTCVSLMDPTNAARLKSAHAKRKAAGRLAREEM